MCRPLIQTSINEQLRLTKESAAALNLFAQTPHDPLPMLPIYGAEESSEFCRHSIDLAKIWPGSQPAIGVEGRNHFNVIEGIADPQSIIFKTICAVLSA